MVGVGQGVQRALPMSDSEELAHLVATRANRVVLLFGRGRADLHDAGSLDRGCLARRAMISDHALPTFAVFCVVKEAHQSCPGIDFLHLQV